ncbi:glutaminase domain-containing protein [Candidatus Hydrogenedentota bacterium]
MFVYETILGRLGSRFSLNFRSRQNFVAHSGMGRYYDAPVDLAIGIKDGKNVRTLPFTKKYEHFSSVKQDITLTSITYRAHEPEMETGLEVTFTAPFYPRDEKISTAPFYYIDIKPILPLKKHMLTRERFKNAKIFVEVRRPATKFSSDGKSIAMDYNVKFGKQSVTAMIGAVFAIDDLPKIKEVKCSDLIAPIEGDCKVTKHSITAPFTADCKPLTLTWASFTKDNVLEAKKKLTKFKYTEFFRKPADVVKYSVTNRAAILKKCKTFDTILGGSSLGKSTLDFIAFTFQSFLTNTWWTRFRGGKDWFSVWEGICKFHSTIDVEYNLGLVYFALWPDLLELTCEEWIDHEKDGFMSHDMGSGIVANKQHYPHEMEIEENCNFILIVHALWRFMGKKKIIKTHVALIKRLVQFFEDCDTTGNGFPDIGTANTIDDASAAVQYSKEQTYLGVKVMCACRVGALIAKELDDPDFARQCNGIAGRILKTLDSEAWLGDHYAVCLDKETKGLIDVWSHKPLAGKYLQGWDAYSLYSSNGLLYPMLTGTKIKLDHDRIKTDLVNAARESMGEYGCTHSSADKSNGWVSQNLWRDCIAGYYGIDMLDMAERYWAFELSENVSGQGRCFTDTFGWNNLCYYPRGITSIGLLFAALGLTVDRIKKVVTLNPVRVPCNIPILPFANWRTGKIPWATFKIVDGKVKGSISDKRLLKGFRVSMPK